MRIASIGLIAASLAALAGCGGGGGGSSTPPPGGGGPPLPVTTIVKVDVLWPVRSRAVNAPSSALSAVVTLKGAGSGGSDFTFSFDRDSSTTQHTSQHVSATEAVTGTWPMTIDFHAGRGGAGDLVATASPTVQLASDGTLKNPDGSTLGSINPSITVASVDITPGQSVLAGTTADLTFTARDAGGGVVAVSPGSAIFQTQSGSSVLGFVNGQAQGLAPGSASVTATVDGKTSPVVTVTVTSNTSVSVTPSSAALPIGGTRQLAATVTGQPAGGSSAVTWSVTEGAAGGSVSASGLYSAPAVPGTYHVVATSQYDGTKSATCTLTVQAGGATGTIQ
jgi:hypothetical protein